MHRFTSTKSSQTGFTLIEALIAFVVLTVGILGALLFHSTLLRESGQSKAQIEAVKIAERLIEEQRGKSIYGSESELLAALTSAASASIPSIQGKNTIYSVNWGTPETVSGATSVYMQTLSVSWLGGSISLSPYFGWIDPNNTLAANEVGSGKNGEYSGDIPIPSGTLTAIERLEVANIASVAAGTEIRDGITRFTDTDEKGNDREVIAVEVEDGVYVKLAELSESDNEIFTISGRIYNNWNDAARRVNLKFREVYRTNAGEYFDEIIDIRATGGANCVIGKYENDADDKGLYADYLCVAGTGWNGTIYPYYRVLDGTSIKEIDIQEVQGVEAAVCAPRQRSYRYFTVTISSSTALERLNGIIVDGSVGTVSSAREILDELGAEYVGQSGLVRFYPTASAAEISSEGVAWEDYFFHNPNYIVSPALGSSDIDLASAAYSSAFEGYQVPLFSSSAVKSFSVNYPGDVAYQNFYLVDPTVKVGNSDITWDCDEVVSQAFASIVSGASADRLDYGYLASAGVPGYQSVSGANTDWGYTPDVPASNAYDSSDYNQFEWTAEKSGNNYVYTPDFRGTFVLGYTLATNTISGYLYYPIAYSGGSFEMAGNPEPVVSIECTISDTQTLEGSRYKRAYSCGVPTNWKGNILAYYGNSDLGSFESCDRVFFTSAVSTSSISAAGFSRANYPEDWGRLSPDEDYWPGVIYYVTNELSGTASVDSQSIKLLGIKKYPKVADSLTDENFYFSSSAVSCP